jgi:hypothetical protein
MKRQTESWRQKVAPFFVETANAYKEAIRAWQALGPNPPTELVAEIETHLFERTEEIRKHYPPDLVSTAPDSMFSAAFEMLHVEGPGTWPPSQQEMDQGFLELLYWKHYREPLWIALQKSESGDLEAYRRVTRISEDYERLRFGKGPIKAAKGNPDHSALFKLGLDLGLNRLSAEELADCFEAVCPCRDSHDADTLKKQRSRFVKALNDAATWLQKARAKVGSREWMIVYGKDQLFAKAVQLTNGQTRRFVVVGQLGKQAECYVNELGELSCAEGSYFKRSSYLRKMLLAFGVESTKELFAMFFPEPREATDS